MTRRGAFTLIEMLVSVAIIALLISIAMPSISAAKRVSKKTQCQHNLHQIGVGMQAYLQQNKDVFPWIARLPSIEKEVARIANRKPYIPFSIAMAREFGARSKVLQCPADVVTEIDPDTQASIIAAGSRLQVGQPYYNSEETSYDWTTQVNGLHRNLKTVVMFSGEVPVPLRMVPIVFDYEAYHGGPRIEGSLNNLYADLRVVSK